jgi:hypothetical protein
MLQLLMAPLQVPVLVQQQQQQQQQPHSMAQPSRPQVLAAARNAAIEPFFSSSRNRPACSEREQQQYGPEDAELRLAELSDTLQAQLLQLQQQQSSRRALQSRCVAPALWQMTPLTAGCPQHLTATDHHLSCCVHFCRLPVPRPGQAAADNGVGSSSSPMAVLSKDANSSTSSSSSRNRPEPERTATAPGCFNPESVVFVDGSTLLCKADLQRLLQHSTADLACAMDLHLAEASPPPPSAPAATGDSVGGNGDAAAASRGGTAASGDGEEAAELVPTLPVVDEAEAFVSRRQQRRLQQQQQQQQQAAPASDAHHVHHRAHSELQLQLRQRQRQQQQISGSVTAAVQLAALHAVSQRPPSLDLWTHPIVYAGASTGRMLNGQPFSAAPFFATSHAPTLRRLVAGLPAQVRVQHCELSAHSAAPVVALLAAGPRPEGLTLPQLTCTANPALHAPAAHQAYCCWSGVVKASVQPFQQGLRFRAQPVPGECPSATDTTLLCDDLHRLGFNKVLVDSGVLLTHDLAVSLRVTPLVRAADRAPYIRRSRWVEVQGSGFSWDLDPVAVQQTKESVQCCVDPMQQQQPWQTRARGVSTSSAVDELLTVDELVQAGGAGRRPGGPLPLRS